MATGLNPQLFGNRRWFNLRIFHSWENDQDHATRMATSNVTLVLHDRHSRSRPSPGSAEKAPFTFSQSSLPLP
jgi:hypothetical protein